VRYSSVQRTICRPCRPCRPHRYSRTWNIKIYKPIIVLVVLYRCESFPSHSRKRWGWQRLRFWGRHPDPRLKQQDVGGNLITRSLMVYTHQTALGPLTVVSRSKVQNVFARSTTGIMGSNPTTGTAVGLRRCCTRVILCKEGPYNGLIPRERISYQLSLRFIIPD
jgi:hypothetical protein